MVRIGGLYRKRTQLKFATDVCEGGARIKEYGHIIIIITKTIRWVKDATGVCVGRGAHTIE